MMTTREWFLTMLCKRRTLLSIFGFELVALGALIGVGLVSIVGALLTVAVVVWPYRKH